MSSVNAAGKRGPGVVRAAVKISLGCVLLGGCSAGTEQFTSLEFGSGYEASPPRSSTSASAAAINTSQYRPVQQTASSQPKPQSGYQLASASPEQSGGYLQVSRVDLPPVQQPSSSLNRRQDSRRLWPLRPRPYHGWELPRAARLFALRSAKRRLSTASPATIRRIQPAASGLLRRRPKQLCAPAASPTGSGRRPLCLPAAVAEPAKRPRIQQQCAAARVCVLRARSAKQRARGRPEND